MFGRFVTLITIPNKSYQYVKDYKIINQFLNNIAPPATTTHRPQYSPVGLDILNPSTTLSLV